jgi:hypothetical protein
VLYNKTLSQKKFFFPQRAHSFEAGCSRHAYSLSTQAGDIGRSFSLGVPSLAGQQSKTLSQKNPLEIPKFEYHYTVVYDFFNKMKVFQKLLEELRMIIKSATFPNTGLTVVVQIPAPEACKSFYNYLANGQQLRHKI